MANTTKKSTTTKKKSSRPTNAQLQEKVSELETTVQTLMNALAQSQEEREMLLTDLFAAKEELAIQRTVNSYIPEQLEREMFASISEFLSID